MGVHLDTLVLIQPKVNVAEACLSCYATIGAPRERGGRRAAVGLVRIKVEEHRRAESILLHRRRKAEEERPRKDGKAERQRSDHERHVLGVPTQETRARPSRSARDQRQDQEEEQADCECERDDDKHLAEDVGRADRRAVVRHLAPPDDGLFVGEEPPKVAAARRSHLYVRAQPRPLPREPSVHVHLLRSPAAAKLHQLEMPVCASQ